MIIIMIKIIIKPSNTWFKNDYEIVSLSYMRKIPTMKSWNPVLISAPMAEAHLSPPPTPIRSPTSTLQMFSTMAQPERDILLLPSSLFKQVLLLLLGGRFLWRFDKEKEAWIVKNILLCLPRFPQYSALHPVGFFSPSCPPLYRDHFWGHPQPAL